MGPYYASVGPEEGSLRYHEVSGPIAVFEAPDTSVPIGWAECVGWDAAGSAVLRLVVPDADLEDRWVIMDREFILTGTGWRGLYRRDSGRDAGHAARSPRLAKWSGDRAAAPIR
jgi:hypothetical protein